jgi:hypothetical protein
MTIWLAMLLLTGCWAGQVTVHPQDHGLALSNPGMGWDFCYYSNNTNNFSSCLKPGDTLDWWPGSDIVFFRIGWAYLEPEEGKYNWVVTDRIAEEWVKKGKRVAFCWVVCYPGWQDTPLWVKEAGARGVAYNAVAEAAQRGFSYKSASWMDQQGIGFTDTWVPCYDDPVFLEKFRAFLKAAAERYDGKPWVEFVQIGSLGSWGEGHNHLSWPAKITPSIQRQHIDLWSDCFKKTPLFINDDWGGREILAYAKSRGCGIGDHSLQVPGPQFENYTGNPEKAAMFWSEAPVEIENHPGTMPGPLYEQAVETWHASYVRIHSDPYRAWNSSSERIRRMSLRLGYRIQIVEASWPDGIPSGTPCPVSLAFRNAGVAPCYRGGFPTVYLQPVGDGETIAFTDTAFDIRQLQPGASADTAPAVWHVFNVPVPATVRAGRYRVLLSVGDANGCPAINLPYNETDEGKRLKLGEIFIR